MRILAHHTPLLAIMPWTGPGPISTFGGDGGGDGYCVGTGDGTGSGYFEGHGNGYGETLAEGGPTGSHL